MRIDWDTAYDGTTPPFTGKLITANIDLDDDFLINAAAAVQCDPTTPGFETSTTTEALAVCGNAKIGSGSALLQGAVEGVTAVVTVFNGTPESGQPRILLHVRTTGGSTAVIYATVAASPAGADFGHRLQLTVPILPLGFVFTHFDFSMGEPGTPSAGSYLTARCAEGQWNYQGSFQYDTGANRTASDAEACAVRPPAAIPIVPATTNAKGGKKKCKKKKGKKAGVATKKCKKPKMAPRELATAPAAVGYQVCEVPEDALFVYSLEAFRVSCATAQKVITSRRVKCINEHCGEFRKGKWRCTNKGGIAQRTIRCRKGNQVIVAKASGD